MKKEQKQFNGESIDFGTGGTGTTNWTSKRKSNKKIMNLDTGLTPFTIINSKWIVDIHVKQKPIEFIKDNIEENLGDNGLDNEFLKTALKA